MTGASAEPAAITNKSGHPIAAAIAVIVRESSVLLVRRANPPDKGKWGFPGGRIRFGETIEQAAVRELNEETGILGRPLNVSTAVDAFDGNREGKLNTHFVLIAVLCEWISGHPVAGDDALEARWFDLTDLDDSDFCLSFDVARIARQAADEVREFV